MNARKYLYFVLTALILTLVVGCSFPAAASPTATPAFNPIFTSAAQTMVAQMTQIAALATPVPPTATPQQPGVTQIVITQVVEPTAAQPTALPPTNTPEPTWTPLPSNTPIPTAVPTKAPTATATTAPCNQAQFLGDVSVPDDTVFAPDMTFTKIWKLKNTGSCTWNKDYTITYFGGDKLGAQTLYAIPYEVKPGEELDVAITFKSPTQPGTYLSSWQLRSKSGVLFGVGAGGATAFWTKIKVQNTPDVGVYDLATSMCDAKWQNGMGQTLNCPGNPNDSRGFVQYLLAPRFEDGTTDDESTLWVTPQKLQDGVIMGEYPAYTVQAGDRFQAYIGCMYNAPKCNARFTLQYRDASGAVTTLGSWVESYDQKLTFVDIDLGTTLASKSIRLILMVDTAGAPDNDSVFWFTPAVVRP